MGTSSSAAPSDAMALLPASPAFSKGGAGDRGGGGRREGWRGFDGDRAGIANLEGKYADEDLSGKELEGGDGEEEEEEEAAAALPLGFIPEVAFDDAPSVRFVFSATLEPAPAFPNRSNKRSNGGGSVDAAGDGDGDGEGSRERRLVDDGGEWWWWRRRRRRSQRVLAVPATKAAATAAAGRRDGVIVAEMETEWTPLTRIREEHAPMPAPETKCMQVRGVRFVVLVRAMGGAKNTATKKRVRSRLRVVALLGVCMPWKS